MSDKQVDPQETGLDEHGLVVHTYVSTVLVVVPASGYAETTLRYARSALHNIHVGTRSVSTETEELIKGELQDEFQVDQELDSSVTLEGYSGVLFCGGRGAGELADQPEVQRLAREAASAGKLIGAWGESVGVLVKAGILRKRKVTGAPALREAVQAAGGRYTGTQVERDGNLITALDDAAGFRFGKALVQVVGI